MTPDRAEFWLALLARGVTGLAVLFILAVMLGLLRQLLAMVKDLRGREEP